MHRATIVVITLYTLFGELYSSDCNEGYCLPPPENVIQGVNTKSQRTLSVSSLCGQNGDYSYVKFPDTGDPTVFTCDPDYHQASQMFDGDPDFTTYWQSENSVSRDGNITEQNIVLNLTNKFAMRSILIGFTSPHVSSSELSDVRPKALVIESWSADADLFVPWQYYSYDCATSFPGVPYQPIDGPARQPTSAVCKEQYYSGDTATRELGKPYQFVLYSPFADFDTLYIRNQTIQQYFTSSAIRIRLVEPSDPTELASYYAVSTLQINGSCSCYGHADRCMGENNEICECKHNTQGDNCDKCQPLYNTEPWRLATDVNSAHCTRCDCNENADSCTYNTTLSAAVCDGCGDNSYGDQCELCERGYYSDSTADKNTVCQECECDGEGVKLSVEGDTVCNSTTGQCPCKAYVTGRLCDQCLPGYWNLTADDEFGCTECNCSSEGSEPTLCDSVTGGCVCKSNVFGDRCDICKPLTFNLTHGNEFGCTDCGCLPGSSARLACELDSMGQCGCIENIGGRTCDTPLQGYFIPKIDHIQFEPSPITEVQVPSSGDYTILSSVQSSAGSISTIANVTQSCPSTNSQTVFDGASVCLVSDVIYTLNLTLPSVITLIPVSSNLLRSTGGQLCLSELLSGQTERSEICTQLEYSVMAELYSAALLCFCDSDGSFSPHLCDPYSGQCYCKPGVTGRSCDRCGINYYNFTSQGCTSCSCDTDGSVSEQCDSETGVCSCLPNVIGDKCDACQPEHYGLKTGFGCRECVCTQYSVDNRCRGNGTCVCKPGVGGDLCTQCLPGFYSLTEDGCTDCGCDEIGSLGSSCSDDGVCQCKNQVSGSKCDQCSAGFFRLWHNDLPCKMCYCSGHTYSCEVQPGWSEMTVSDRWSLLDQGILELRWSVISSQRDVQVTGTEIYHQGNDVQEISVFTSPVTDDKFYFSATDKYLGDLRAAYYQRLNFSISYSPSNLTHVRGLSAGRVRIRGGDVELWSLMTILPPHGELTEYSLRLHESEFYSNETGRRATLPEMLNLLDNTTEILIPASFDLLSGSATKLYSVALETGVRNLSGSTRRSLSNVAACNCPPGYQGDRCESCIEGYTRHPSGSDYATSQCIPCDCSGASCDSVTGDCVCTGDTTGMKCEKCADEYYGDPSSGIECQRCTCYGSDNQTCTMDIDRLQTCTACGPGHTGRQCEYCDDGFYGDPMIGSGVCTACDCSGFSTQCDTISGVCIDCQNNTTGDHCQNCAEGLYGDPLSTGCQECNCTGQGVGFDPICDSTTGECGCLLGLDIRRDCGVCLPKFYGKFLLGCLPCTCDTDGTVDSSNTCDNETGQCNCIPNVAGRDCSVCQTGFYGKTPQLCTACDCDINGAISNSTCETITGQCQCVTDTVTGRRCSQCLSNTPGDFPQCTPCGDCYDGWKSVLSQMSLTLDQTFYQLRNLSSQYAGYSPDEIERIVTVIQTNITQAQNLYSSAVQLINASSEVKLGFLMAHSSLHILSEQIDSLTVQHQLYTENLHQLNISYSSSAISSILESLQKGIMDTQSNNSLIYSQLVTRTKRINSTLQNMTESQQTAQVLQKTVETVMERVSQLNMSYTQSSSVLYISLMESLNNITYQLMSDNRTLSTLSVSLEGDRVMLTALNNSLADMSRTASNIQNSVMSSYMSASEERAQTDSLYQSVSRSKRDVLDLLAMVNIYETQAGVLQRQITEMWITGNQTESNIDHVADLLEIIQGLSQNITRQEKPDLSNMESMLMWIYEHQLDFNDTQTYVYRSEEYKHQADELLEQVKYSESEVSQVVEEIESAERDLSAADMQTNNTSRKVNGSIEPLQQRINQMMSQMSKELVMNDEKTIEVLSNLEVFQLLTNQIQECRENSTYELLNLNTSSSLLYEQALNAHQTSTDINSGRSQIFLRLQLQAMAVQRSHVNLAQSTNQQRELSQRINAQKQQLLDLMEQFRVNELKLESLESQISEAEQKLTDYIDSLQMSPDQGCQP